MYKEYHYKKHIFILTIVLIEILINIVWAEGINDPLCGPKSLLSICQKYGISTTIEEICALSEYKEKTGTTMLGLYQAANKKGLPAVPLKIELEQLCSIMVPSIAFVDGNHFLVVQGCKGDKVTIQNPPDTPYSVSKEVFNKRWKGGEALVFSESLKEQMASQIIEKTAPLQGPNIHFYETEWDFGVIDEGEVLSHKFKFVNIGTDTLKVSARSTCSCTSTLLSDKIILPGDVGEISPEFNTKGFKGPSKQSIYVRTNDPNKKEIILTIAATIRTSIKVIPENLWLDDLVIGEELIREILVVDSGDRTLKVESIEVPKGINAEILPVRDNATIKYSIPVMLTIKSGTEPGKFEKEIIVHTNDPSKPKISVPVSGIVLSEIKAIPTAIFFGEIEQNTKIEREITLSPTNGKRLEIVKAKSSLPYISTEIKTINDGLEFKLVTTLLAPKISTTVSDNIMIYINGNDEPAIEVPLYARVVDIQKINE